MKTKALLLAGLMAATSVASLQAQTVYSVNSVGFVNLTLPPGFSLISNPLTSSDNGVAALFPNAPSDSAVFKFNPSTGFYSRADYVLGIWFDAATPITIQPGEGIFFKNPSSTNYSVTFTGEVPQGNLVTPIPAGFSIVSSQVPQSGGLQSDLGYTPSEDDAIFKFDTQTQSYKRYDFVLGLWFDSLGLAEPQLTVGEAVFIKKLAASNWVRSFSVSDQ